MSRYGFFGSLRIVLSFLYTKLFFYNARLIRLPFDIRNKKFIKLGKGFTSGYGCRIEAYPNLKVNKKILKIGENVQINDYVHIACGESITIGDNVLIASKVFITDISHGCYDGVFDNSDPFQEPKIRKLYTKPVEIMQNVWIGEFVSILPGVTIGKGSIIGSNSVVTKDVPDYVIAVGCPAIPIKKYSFEDKLWKKIL